MKITTATLITMLALGSSIAFAQNGAAAPAQAETPEIYTVTVTTLMRPIVPNSATTAESSDFQVSRSEDVTVNVKPTDDDQEPQPVLVEKASGPDTISVR